MEWYLLVLKRYAEFSGRSRRKEYWMFTLYNTVILVVLELAGFLTLERSGISIVFFGLVLLYGLGVMVPSLAAAVRRLHDTGKSGWFLLICLIPIVSLALIVLLCLDSTPGDNQYGPNPKGVGAVGQAAAIG
jgi:uncharacterized membrane protein YhaH (DUF805 family)